MISSERNDTPSAMDESMQSKEKPSTIEAETLRDRAALRENDRDPDIRRLSADDRLAPVPAAALNAGRRATARRGAARR